MNLLAELDKLRSVLTIRSPFLASVLRNVRIVSSRRVPTAAVNRWGEVYINPEFFSRLEARDKLFILCHEALHVAFSHAARMGSRSHKLWNVATDCVINYIVSRYISMSYELVKIAITPETVAYATGVYKDEIEKMSAEEVYELLVKEAGAGGIDIEGRFCGDIEPDFTDDEAEVIQSGNGEIYDGKTPEEREELWRRKLAEAYSAEKTAGRVPAGVQRIIDKILKAKVPWWVLLKQAIREGIGRSVISTYRRPNRKIPVLPGLKRFTIPTIWSLVDTSGSIGEEELSQFISEEYAMARISKVVNICWDAEAYDVIEARSPSEVIRKIAGRIRGYGGTMIKPCLKKTLKLMRNGDIVVILSDFEIFDWDDEEVERLMKQIRVKASTAILVSTYRVPEDTRGWRMIKIES